MAQLALMTAGKVIGTALGGPLGGAIGGAIGSYLGTMLTAEDIVGPRLDNLGVAGGEEGPVVPQIYGRGRVVGHIIATDDLEEHRHEESAAGKGGPSIITFTYTLTYAVCWGEPRMGAGLVRRVWSNKALHEDYSDAADGNVKGTAATHYDGTQTEPDPDLEALIGLGNVPAYTGFAYSVYKDRDVGEFGNRAPVDEAEIVVAGAAVASWQNIYPLDANSHSLGGVVYSQASDKVYFTFLDYYDSGAMVLVEFDPYTRQITQRVQGSFTAVRVPRVVSGAYALGTDDLIAVPEFYAYGRLELFSVHDGLQHVASVNTGNTLIATIGESELFMAFQVNTQTLRFVRKDDLTWTTVSYPSGYAFSKSIQLIGYNQFLVQFANGSSFGVLTLDEDGGYSWDSIVDNTGYGIVSANDGPFDTGDGDYWWGGTVTSYNTALIVTDATGTLQRIYWTTADLGLQALRSGVNSRWFDAATRTVYYRGTSIPAAHKINALDVDTMQGEEFEFEDALGTYGGADLVWHPPTTRVVMSIPVATNNWRIAVIRLRSVSEEMLSVADALADLCEQVGLLPAEIDTTGITATIGGFVNGSQAAARAMVDMLLTLVQGYVVSSDWSMKFLPLGAASVATVDANDLGAIQGGSAPPQPLVEDDPEFYAIPRRWQVFYVSQSGDMEPATVVADNPVGDSLLNGANQFPAILDDTAAAELVQKLLLLSNEGRVYRFSLMPSYGALDAGDPITLPTSQGDVRARLLSVDRGANGVLSCMARADNPEDLVANAVAAGGREASVIVLNSPPVLIYLDVPLLRDVDLDHPGPYLTGFTYGAGFPGIQFLSSADAQEYALLGITDTEPVVASCSTVPADVDFEAWDETNTLRVELIAGSALASATDNNLLYGGGNVAAWGRPGRWEIVQFGVATLVSDGVYDLSHLLRGRRGSDGHMDSHQAGDLFVVLTDGAVVRQVLALADVGTDRQYKAVSYGGNAADAAVREYTVGDTPYLPYSPSAIDSADNATLGAIDISWDWRTRYQGVYGGPNGITDGLPGIQHDETTGSVRFHTEVGALITTRVAASSAYTYSQADRLTDYGGETFAVYVSIAQDASTTGVSQGTFSAVKTLRIGFTVLAADAGVFQVIRPVRDADGNSFFVKSAVKNSSGTAYEVI